METKPATTEALTEKQVELAAKWSKFGVDLNKTDMKLQSMAQKAILKIAIPTTVAQIVDAEKLLIEIRNDYKAIMEERKLVTGRFDKVTAHLMEPEKSIVAAIPALTDAILKLKKQAEAEEAKTKYHDDEIKRNKELISNHIANFDAECKKKILDIVTKAYNYALGNGDVKLEELPNYITKVMRKFGEAEFVLKAPLWQSKYSTQEENQEIWDNAAMDVKSPMDYRQELADALNDRFELYNIALNNKATALAQAEIEKNEAEAKINTEVDNAKVSATLESMSTTHSATPVATHKALKKVYELPMVENDEKSAIIVMAAFVANLDKCRGGVRVTDIWNLSIKQMTQALCWYKNQNESFEMSGVKFNLVEKL